MQTLPKKERKPRGEAKEYHLFMLGREDLTDMEK